MIKPLALLYESDPHNAKLFAGVLQREGYEVRAFQLEALKAASVKGVSPQLVFLGLNGESRAASLRLAKRVRGNPDWGQAKLIVAAAEKLLDARLKALADVALCKPVSQAAFSQEAARLHAEWQTHSEAKNRDGLTGLSNDIFFNEQVKRAVERANQDGNYIYSVLTQDCDGFPRIVEVYGEETSEGVLVEMGKRLRSVVRATDTIARLGRGKFVVLVEGLQNKRNAVSIANRIKREVEGMYYLRGKEVPVSLNTRIVFGDERYARAEEVMGEVYA